MNVRNKCLKERISELKSENKDLLRTMEELKTRLKSSREKLCSQSWQFIEERNLFNQKQLSSLQMEVLRRDKTDDLEKENQGNCLTILNRPSENYLVQRVESARTKDSDLKIDSL